MRGDAVALDAHDARRLPYRGRPFAAGRSRNEPTWPLTVAVQMDPIERINIAGDSTFALMLEAQARGHALSYYTPDRLALRRRACSRRCEPLSVRDVEGDHATPRRAAARVDLSRFDVVLLRQDPPFDLAYITTTHLLERLHPKTLVVNDPRARAQRAGKAVRHGISRADAADADHPRPRGDRGVPRASTATS